MSDAGKTAQKGKLSLKGRETRLLDMDLKQALDGKLSLKGRETRLLDMDLKQALDGKLELKGRTTRVLDELKEAQKGKLPLKGRRTRLLDMDLKGTIPIKSPPPKKGAARVTDDHSCPAVTGSAPHKGGPILPPCAMSVLVNGLAQARVTDKAKCNGPTDTIVTGSASVFAEGKNATRMGEKTAHGGKILPPCSPDTFIGGPATGCVVGEVEKVKEECMKMRKGRHTYHKFDKGFFEDLKPEFHMSRSQSFSNCGLESTRLLVYGGSQFTPSEAFILHQATNRKDKWATLKMKDGKPDVKESGGAFAAGRKKILDFWKVDSTIQENTFENIQQAISEGKGVISIHQAGKLWGTTQEGYHAVVPSAIKYDENGEPTSVFVTDSGLGTCAEEVPIEKFEKSLVQKYPYTSWYEPSITYKLNVTKNPIW
jgi:uncharacterized Zn-binding protein involved in type VI secretion